jgi:hypothetical protein
MFLPASVAGLLEFVARPRLPSLPPPAVFVPPRS